MIVAITNGSKTLTCQFTESEWELVDWIRAIYGPDAFTDLLKNYLASRGTQKRESEKEELHKAFLDVDENTKETIRIALKIGKK